MLKRLCSETNLNSFLASISQRLPSFCSITSPGHTPRFFSTSSSILTLREGAMPGYAILPHSAIRGTPLASTSTRVAGSAQVGITPRPGFQHQAPLQRSLTTTCMASHAANPAEASTDLEPTNGVALNGSGKKLRDYTEVAYLTGRARVVTKHFPTAIGIDDFLHRLEIALYAYGFNGDNSIAMVNLCRDEITVSLKHKIDQVFGSSFNTNGLGGVLTCGVTGVAAGLSHAPVSKGSGKERYVFFSFPHISIDAQGEVGTISRPGRPGSSCACGALNQALIDIKSQGLTSNCKIPGVHEPLDPEFTILKQRLARRLRYDGVDDAAVGNLDLVEITKVAERTIADDLDYLISHTVDHRKADYAVVTGIQVHNWGARFDDESPNLEFVAPASVYVVVNGAKTQIDLNTMPSLTPRQIRILSAKAESGADGRDRGPDVICNSGGSSTLREIDPPYLYNSRETRRRQRERAETFAALIHEEGLTPDTTCPWPSWQSNLRLNESRSMPDAGNSAMHFDSNFQSGDELQELWSQLQTKYVSAGSRKENGNGNGTGSYTSGDESDSS